MGVFYPENRKGKGTKSSFKLPSLGKKRPALKRPMYFRNFHQRIRETDGSVYVGAPRNIPEPEVMLPRLIVDTRQFTIHRRDGSPIIHRIHYYSDGTVERKVTLN